VSLAADARILWSLLRGAAREGSHAQRLQRFYGPQAEGYDAFRERLLHGRRELIQRLPARRGMRVIELGGGTGRNLEFFGPRLHGFASVEVVDLCPALLAVAQRRADRLASGGRRNVAVIEADATEYRPAEAPDVVYFSYALTMIPEWRRAIDNAVAMLAPGGALGVVDFHLPAAGGWSNRFWRAWFGHDGVRLSEAHLPYLEERMQPVHCERSRGSVPFLPGLRVPFYVFVGCKAPSAAGG
jgi:S-adenosylmethionine-diacylgycerolhomoserine-N-methlytransferase